MRHFARWILALALLLPSAAGAEPIKLKLSFFSSDRSEAYRSAVKPFVDAVNAEASGLIEIQVYFSGALGRDQSKTAQSVRDGTADIAFVITGLAQGEFRDNTALEMPGLFRDAGEATLTFTRLMGANALKGYDDFYTIGTFATEPETIHSRPPIAALKDLKGLRIGTNNPTQGAALERLGMRAVILPVSDYANAIAAGELDAVAKSPSIVFDFGIARLATYHYLLKVSVLPMALLMNRKTFEALPQAAQAIVRKYSGEWAAARFIEAYVAIDKAAMDKLASDPKRKIVYPTPADLAAARRTFDSFTEQWAATDPNHRALLRQIESEIVRIRGGK